jgi:hypothetical protein
VEHGYQGTRLRRRPPRVFARPGVDDLDARAILSTYKAVFGVGASIHRRCARRAPAHEDRATGVGPAFIGSARPDRSFMSASSSECGGQHSPEVCPPRPPSLVVELGACTHRSQLMTIEVASPIRSECAVAIIRPLHLTGRLNE